MTRLVRVQSVEPREDFIVEIHFTDGSQREINLGPYLRGPIFEPIRNDPSLFRSMRVEEGTITWPNGADIDPDVLYYDLTPHGLLLLRHLAPRGRFYRRALPRAK